MKIKQIKIKQKNTAQAYKWKYKAVFAAILGASLLAGCQETPKNSIVKQKSTDNMNQYESTEEAKGNISNIVKAPETYKNKATYENGALVIDTDAEIILPEADSINTYKVSAQEASQELFDKVTKAFFEGDKIYHAHGYYQWTKERYQEEITKLKKYKSEGNLDPYGYGTDENGELMFRIDEEIARNEAELEHAPDEIEKKEVTPSFGLEWVNGTGEEAQKGCVLRIQGQQAHPGDPGGPALPVHASAGKGGARHAQGAVHRRDQAGGERQPVHFRMAREHQLPPGRAAGHHRCPIPEIQPVPCRERIR